MKKKKGWIIGIVLLSIGIVIALIVFLSLVWNRYIEPTRTSQFELKDYEYYLTEFPYEKFVGPIDDSRTAKEKGIAVLKEIYGDEIAEEEAPFYVSYDRQNDAWLIHGSLPMLPLMDGGVGYVILSGTDGDVLAVWHTK